MIEKSSRKRMVIIIGIIVVLILVGLYFLVVRPSINGYAVKLQNNGVMIALSTILSQVNQYGYTVLPVLGTNQTITLIPPQLCSQLAKNSTLNLTG
jgi:Tfp pilus assembly protein PilE